MPHKHFGRLAGGNHSRGEADDLSLLPGGGKYGCIMLIVINTMSQEFAVDSGMGGDCVCVCVCVCVHACVGEERGRSLKEGEQRGKKRQGKGRSIHTSLAQIKFTTTTGSSTQKGANLPSSPVTTDDASYVAAFLL